MLEIRALLLVALARLEARPEASHTTVDQAVLAAGEIIEGRLRGLVNAVLRNYLRRREELALAVAANEVALHQHPAWWLDALRTAWPEDWKNIAAAGNMPPPMALRVNQRRISPVEYLKQLAAAEIGAHLDPQGAILLDKPIPVDRLPGFAEGLLSVQDPGAQRAAILLDPAPGSRVLDACAAPGGKTAHLLEWAGPQAALHVTALDIDPARCARINDTLQRLGLQSPAQVQVLAADAGRPQDWWPQHCASQLFDAILLDAPCTASGIVRRHPDVRWLRRETDIAQLAQTQARLLATLWPLLRPGGRLLYCTCSVFLAEGDQQIKAFLARHTDAALLPSPGHLWPGKGAAAGSVPDNLSSEHDGFFYALLHKCAP